LNVITRGIFVLAAIIAERAFTHILPSILLLYFEWTLLTNYCDKITTELHIFAVIGNYFVQKILLCRGALTD
jgi:hypothetical protein